MVVGQLGWYPESVCQPQCVQCSECPLFDSSLCLLPSAAVGSAEALEPGTTGRAAALAAAAPAAAGQPAAGAAGAAAGASEVRGAAAPKVLAGVKLDVMFG